MSTFKALFRKCRPRFYKKLTKQHRCVILHEISDYRYKKFKQLLKTIDRLPFVNVTLTFDDGFFSSYKTIRGLKKEKAIFFICPSFIDTLNEKSAIDFIRNCLALNKKYFITDKLNSDFKPVTWDQLYQLVQVGHVVGAHTANHIPLTQITSQKELEKEIIGSGDTIEDRLNTKIECFSYPFGDVKSINRRAYNIIKKRYKYCYTGIRGNNCNNQNRYTLWRDHIDLSWPLDYIEYILNGGLDWYYYIKRKKVLRMAD